MGTHDVQTQSARAQPVPSPCPARPCSCPVRVQSRPWPWLCSVRAQSHAQFRPWSCPVCVQSRSCPCSVRVHARSMPSACLIRAQFSPMPVLGLCPAHPFPSPLTDWQTKWINTYDLPPNKMFPINITIMRDFFFDKVHLWVTHNYQLKTIVLYCPINSFCIFHLLMISWTNIWSCEHKRCWPIGWPKVVFDMVITFTWQIIFNKYHIIKQIPTWFFWQFVFVKIYKYMYCGIL